MNSIILATVSRLLTGLLLVFSVFLLLRGHNLPGGGFAGGLVAARAVSSGPMKADTPSRRPPAVKISRLTAWLSKAMPSTTRTTERRRIR